MNLPNKLTVFRVILIPFFLFFLLNSEGNNLYLAISLVIFCVACITDYFDGYIARKHNLITNFGKFMDPIADKLLVNSAIISLLAINQIGVLVTIIIICREILISGFRLVAVSNNIVIAAGPWGKRKTVVQMIMVIYLLTGLQNLSPTFEYIGVALTYAGALLAIISGYDYIIKNLDVLKD
ncbi:MAG: CDP-diacylglycerol--glycerol-3-phosphate 3-phosphatidyltransferase [Lachnospirales bacterium]